MKKTPLYAAFFMAHKVGNTIDFDSIEKEGTPVTVRDPALPFDSMEQITVPAAELASYLVNYFINQD